MKEFIISLSCLLLFFLLQCAGEQKNASVPAVVACKERCSTTFDECIKKALKSDNVAKKAACEAVKNKCYNDCEINPEGKPARKGKPVKK